MRLAKRNGTERNAFALPAIRSMRAGCIQRRTIADETVTNSDTAGNVETGRAAVVLTNDLTPVWTIAFDEIRIISVGACQCKCHTYIQLPLVTLRSTAGHGTNQVTPLFHRVSLPARSTNRESPSHTSLDSPEESVTLSIYLDGNV